MDNTLLLLPSYGNVIPSHILSLANSGCDARHIFGAPIDQARSYMIEDALTTTSKDVFLFIDSDISFERKDIEAIVESCVQTKAIVSGIYVLKNNSGQIVGSTEPNIQTDREDGLIPAKYVGMGFCAIHREALEKTNLTLERCKIQRPHGMCEIYPLFIPMVHDGIYFGEDYAFCIRAKNAGIPIFLNTTVLVTHWGIQGYKLQK